MKTANCDSRDSNVDTSSRLDGGSGLWRTWTETNSIERLSYQTLASCRREVLRWLESRSAQANFTCLLRRGPRLDRLTKKTFVDHRHVIINQACERTMPESRKQRRLMQLRLRLRPRRKYERFGHRAGSELLLSCALRPPTLSPPWAPITKLLRGRPPKSMSTSSVAIWTMDIRAPTRSSRRRCSAYEPRAKRWADTWTDSRETPETRSQDAAKTRSAFTPPLRSATGSPAPRLPMCERRGSARCRSNGRRGDQSQKSSEANGLIPRCLHWRKESKVRDWVHAFDYNSIPMRLTVFCMACAPLKPTSVWLDSLWSGLGAVARTPLTDQADKMRQIDPADYLRILAQRLPVTRENYRLREEGKDRRYGGTFRVQRGGGDDAEALTKGSLLPEPITESGVYGWVFSPVQAPVRASLSANACDTTRCTLPGVAPLRSATPGPSAIQRLTLAAFQRNTLATVQRSVALPSAIQPSTSAATQRRALSPAATKWMVALPSAIERRKLAAAQQHVLFPSASFPNLVTPCALMAKRKRCAASPAVCGVVSCSASKDLMAAEEKRGAIGVRYRTTGSILCTPSQLPHDRTAQAQGPGNSPRRSAVRKLLPAVCREAVSCDARRDPNVYARSDHRVPHETAGSCGAARRSGLPSGFRSPRPPSGKPVVHRRWSRRRNHCSSPVRLLGAAPVSCTESQLCETTSKTQSDRCLLRSAESRVSQCGFFMPVAPSGARTFS